MMNLKNLIFGTNSKRRLKKYSLLISQIDTYSENFRNYRPEEFIDKTQELKKRIQIKGEELSSVLPEAFALVRQAADNVLGERHYDVQLIGGMALHDGQIAEMKTGEGKTLTSTLPLYLNALKGKGAILVTVNDYLAARDSEWMGRVFSYLGMSVGLILNGQGDLERQSAYACDITYCTNSELGFDFLRDNMKYNIENLVQRDFYYCIVDEVDSILIDEARTPLIISGPSDDSTDKYEIIGKAVYGLKRAYRIADNPDKSLITETPNELSGFDDIHISVKESRIVVPGDFVLDEKTKNIQLTDEGVEIVEGRISDLLGGKSLHDAENMVYLHHVQQALKALYVFKREVDYLIQDNGIAIVDEFTGRIMQGRRYSDGLHQALEAKEGLKVQKENQTLASITYQNLFRKFDKLAGMTGTAETEEEEFQKIYGLGVVVIPTNKPLARIDNPDSIYKTKEVKKKAIVDLIAGLHEKGQPVLVGTDSIEYSEELSAFLKKQQIKHNVLNAKYFAQEAEIIANAGKKSSVTIATNMAGRGTDIKLEEGVKDLGGLYIVGAVRHESRRIDNQLRGRSGRQGDPGESKFIISLEDDILRVFGGERISKIMTTLKIDESEAIEHPLISRAIENSQKTVESRNFSVRKHLLEYDDIINKHREIIYARRKDILKMEFGDLMNEMVLEHAESLIDKYLPLNDNENWDIQGLKTEIEITFRLSPDTLEEIDAAENSVQKKILDSITDQYTKKSESLGQYDKKIQQRILLEVTDIYWREHFLNMDHLRESVSLSGYAQKNPLDEYKKGAFELFQLMHYKTISAVSKYFFSVVLHGEYEEVHKKQLKNEKLTYSDSAPTPHPQQAPKTENAKKPYTSVKKAAETIHVFVEVEKKYKIVIY